MIAYHTLRPLYFSRDNPFTVLYPVFKLKLENYTFGMSLTAQYHNFTKCYMAKGWFLLLTYPLKIKKQKFKTSKKKCIPFKT